jgi:protein SCO1/2
MRPVTSIGKEMKKLAWIQDHLWVAIVFLLALSMAAGAVRADTSVPSAAPIAGNSVYQLRTPLVDQDGRAFQLESKRGQPVLISMFYNSCQFICPMLIDTLRYTEESLSQEERGRLSILLVTFDPARDDIAALKTNASRRGLDPAHWTLARTDAGNVRKLAAVLGIQYRLLASGEFNHTTALILLDEDGRIVGRSAKLGAVDPDFVKLIQKATSTRK